MCLLFLEGSQPFPGSQPLHVRFLPPGPPEPALSFQGSMHPGVGGVLGWWALPCPQGLRGSGDGGPAQVQVPPSPTKTFSAVYGGRTCLVPGVLPPAGPPLPPPPAPSSCDLGGPQESLWGEGKGLPWGEFLLEALRGSGASGAGRSLVWTVGRGSDNGAWRAELQERN